MDTYFRAQEVQREAVTRDGVPYQRVTITANKGLSPGRLDSLRFFNAYCGAVRATDGVADGPHRMFYFLQAPGEQEKEHELNLVILPALAGRQPERIIIGVSGWMMCPSLPFWRGLMETYRRCGVNVVESHLATSHDDFLHSLREQGHRPWTLMWWFWWNDSYRQAHPEAAAVRFDGSPDPQRICPEIVADPTNDVIAGIIVYPGVHNGRFPRGLAARGSGSPVGVQPRPRKNGRDHRPPGRASRAGPLAGGRGRPARSRADLDGRGFDDARPRVGCAVGGAARFVVRHEASRSAVCATPLTLRGV